MYQDKARIWRSDCQRDLGFYPSKAESSISRRKCPTGDVYKYVGTNVGTNVATNVATYVAATYVAATYVATYVDDLCIIMEDTEKYLEQLAPAPFNYKLKGSGEVNFHLGCGFEGDSDGVLCMHPSRYVDKMEDAYK